MSFSAQRAGPGRARPGREGTAGAAHSPGESGAPSAQSSSQVRVKGICPQSVLDSDVHSVSVQLEPLTSPLESLTSGLFVLGLHLKQRLCIPDVPAGSSCHACFPSERRGPALGIRQHTASELALLHLQRRRRCLAIRLRRGLCAPEVQVEPEVLFYEDHPGDAGVCGPPGVSRVLWQLLLGSPRLQHLQHLQWLQFPKRDTPAEVPEDTCSRDSHMGSISSAWGG